MFSAGSPGAFVSAAKDIATAEVAVIGGGPAGLVSAIALTLAGVETL